MIHSYPWYISDWRDSETRINLTLEERGLYRELLDFCYRERSLPSVERSLAIIAGCSEDEFSRCWPQVKPLFYLDENTTNGGNGRYRHRKVDEILLKIEGYVDQRRQAGIASGERRRTSVPTNGPTSVPTTGQRAYEPSSTTSTSSTSIKKGRKTPPTPSSVEVEKIAREIYARHPARRRNVSVAMVQKKLEAILKHKHINGNGSSAYLDTINRNHESACRSPDWQKNEGEYAKALGNWLAPTEERYEVQSEKIFSSQPNAKLIL